MNAPASTLRPYTGDEMIDALTNGTYWQLDSNRTFTFALADLGPYHWSSIQTGPGNVEAAYAAFAPYVNARFTYVGLYADPTFAPADLVVTLDGGWNFFSSPLQMARAFFPNPGIANNSLPYAFRSLYNSAPGDVVLNLNVGIPLSLSPGAGGFAVLMHEIGHSLGLKHPFDDGGTGHPTFVSQGLGAFDHDWFTIMSYDDSYPEWTPLWHPVTPMIGDVIALQSLYGANLATNAGDTSHVLGNNNMYQTLFDASGMDSLDFSTSSQSWNIDLGLLDAGQVSPFAVGIAMPIQDLTSPTSLYWLLGSFEYVTGSPQRDVIIGSAAADALAGGGGNDTLVGGAGGDGIAGNAGNDTIDCGPGVDAAYFYLAASNYKIVRAGNTVNVSAKVGPEGTDTLTNTEWLHFPDKQVSLDIANLAATVSSATLQSIIELYVAFFNRVPDSGGMEFWIGQAAAGVSIPAIANSFYGAAVQYSSLTGYSVSMSNADFVNVIYRNVLGRSSADSGGLAYWSGALANGSETRGTLVKAILDSAHTFKGHATYGWVADLLDNKYAVGKLFSVDMGLSFNSAEESISEGMRIAAAVTPFNTSTAISLIGVSPDDIHLS